MHPAAAAAGKRFHAEVEHLHATEAAARHVLRDSVRWNMFVNVHKTHCCYPGSNEFRQGLMPLVSSAITFTRMPPIWCYLELG